jgi:hypothetical protein
MTQFVRLPERFAILRTNSYRGPSFQLLESRYVTHNFERRTEYIRHRNDPMRFNVVQDITSDYYNEYQVLEDRNYEIHRRLFKIRYQHPETRVILETLFWLLPYRLVNQENSFPLLEFHTRSWIPRTTYSLPVTVPCGMSRFLEVIESIQQDVLHEIRHREDEQTGGMDIRSFFRSYNHTPPRHLDEMFGEDDQDDRMSIETHYVGAIPDRRSHRYRQSPPPSPRLVESVRIVEVPVERVIVQTRVPPIPKNVGDILLANARAGTDSCPIASTPFSECTNLCVTSCFHIFDTENLNRWREDHTSCPVCRTKIENVVSETRVDGVSTV